MARIWSPSDNINLYNKYRVGWLGVRNGKTAKEIDILNYRGEKDEILGFQKHGCLQFSLVPDGFEINLFLASEMEISGQISYIEPIGVRILVLILDTYAIVTLIQFRYLTKIKIFKVYNFA